MSDEQETQPEDTEFIRATRALMSQPDYGFLTTLPDADVLRLLFWIGMDVAQCLRSLRVPWSPETVAAIEKMAVKMAEEINEEDGWKKDEIP